jgi:hypothetical protein
MNWNMRTETWGLILSISQILEVVVTSAKWIVWNFRQRENGKLLCTFRSEYQNLVFVKFFFTFDWSLLCLGFENFHFYVSHPAIVVDEPGVKKFSYPG